MNPSSSIPGILCLTGLILAVLAIAWMCSSCADYPISISLRSDHGSASYSAKGGIQIEIEK
jgi:hypothetical protein